MLITDERAEVSNLKENTAWVKTSPINDDHLEIANSIGVIADVAESFVPGISSPTVIVDMTGGEFMLMQYSTKHKMFNSEGLITGTVDMDYKDPRSNDDGTLGVTNGDYDPVTNRLICVSYNHHIIRVFKRSDTNGWTKDFDIGTGVVNYNGYIENGKLSYPKSALWLENGNIIVNCYKGKYEASDYSSLGYIMEVSGITGEPIRKVMYAQDVVSQYFTLNTPYASYPYGMLIDIKDKSKMYVSSLRDNKIAYVDIETGFMEKEYTLPPNVGYLSPVAIGLIDGGDTLLRTNNKRELIAIDTTTHDVKWIKSAQKEDFSYFNSGAWSYSNFIELDDNRFLMTDYGSKALSIELDRNEITVQYSPPFSDPELLVDVLEEFDFVKLWGAIGEVDLYNFTTTVKVKDISKVDTVLVELVRKII